MRPCPMLRSDTMLCCLFSLSFNPSTRSILTLLPPVAPFVRLCASVTRPLITSPGHLSLHHQVRDFMSHQMMRTATLLSLCAGALAIPLTRRDNKPSYPFTQMVAFGDNLSDNGNGSYAHCVTSDPGVCGNKVYGFGTWTDGPVAVSYLSTNLGVPLTYDYAYGHAEGGSKFGATIDNSYTQSTANAPSSKDQIANYTSTDPGLAANVGKTLHFLWIGANDINLYHLSTAQASNPKFASDFSAKLAAQVKSLQDAGAKYIFVPGLYAKNISPSKAFYASSQAEFGNMGNSIQEANTAISATLSKMSDNVLYYDVYSFMMDLWKNAPSHNITHLGGEFCDGYSQADWDLCVTAAAGNQFYWMQYLDMTSTVHSLIAADMASTIEKRFGKQSAAVPSMAAVSAPSSSSAAVQTHPSLSVANKVQDSSAVAAATSKTVVAASSSSVAVSSLVSSPTMTASSSTISSMSTMITPAPSAEITASILGATTISTRPVWTSMLGGEQQGQNGGPSYYVEEEVDVDVLDAVVAIAEIC